MINLLFGSPVFVFDCPEDNAEQLSFEIEKISSNFKKSPLANPWDGNILTTFSSGISLLIYLSSIILNNCVFLFKTNKLFNTLPAPPKLIFSSSSFSKTGIEHSLDILFVTALL